MIRAASPHDAALLHALILDHAAFEGSTASLAIAELGDILAAGTHPIHLLVAEGSDGLVGYVAVTFDWSLWRARRYAHLDCLFVSEGARRYGIGKRLFGAAVTFALAEGAAHLEWQTPAWNENAIRFYSREGAHGVSKMRFTLEIP